MDLKTALGQLLFYYAREWDSVEAINESGQYTLVGGDEWSDQLGCGNTGLTANSITLISAVQDSNPFTWSKSKDWY